MTAARARALHRAIHVPGSPAPYDTVHARVHYPALDLRDDAIARASGILPPDRSGAPYPVVVVLGGINVGPECYRWLAEDLCPTGYVVVTYSHVSETAPGEVGLTPGIDVGLVTPETYGTASSATVLAPLLADLARAGDGDGLLSGLLDLDRVGLVGHSAGGTAVLLNLEPHWLPGVEAAVTYGAHSGVATVLGWPAGTVLAVGGDIPLLLLEGDRDGVIAASAERYRAGTESPSADGSGRSGHDPVARTFDERRPGAADCRHVVVRGGTHFSFCHPQDPTTGRGFLEDDPGDSAMVRDRIASLVRSFLDMHLKGTTPQESGDAPEQLENA